MALTDSTPDATLVAYHDCNLLHRKQPLQLRQKAMCSRCGAVLYWQKPNLLDRTLTITLAALISYSGCRSTKLKRLRSLGRTPRSCYPGDRCEAT